MRGLDLDNNSYKTIINNLYNSSYGYNIYKEDQELLDYERFFKTKNNLFAHNNIKR